MFRYEAPNPYEKESFFSSLYSSSSKSIGKAVLPAQSREPIHLKNSSIIKLEEQKNVSIQSCQIITHDEAVIDTIEIQAKSSLKNSESKRSYLVKFNGNGMLYEDALNSFAQDATKLGVTVIGFNYRGVGKSKKNPTIFQELITDGIAQVQRLLDKGVPSINITLDGLSLGGGVATMVASHFHALGKPVYLWNDRSFSALSKAAAGFIAPESKDIFSESLATSLETSSWSLMKSTGWEVNIAKAYDAIPAQYKKYMFVAEKSEQSQGDGVIAYRSSLHTAVSPAEKKLGISTGHKMHAYNFFGHNMIREALVSDDNPSVSGQDKFEEFMKAHIR